jgi:hypothetical protein
MRNDPMRVRENEVTEMRREMQEIATEMRGEIKEIKSTLDTTITHRQVLWFVMAVFVALIGAFFHPLGK